MKTKDRIWAIIGRKGPKGRHPNKYWEAFVFSPNALQNDVEDFMCAIHKSLNDYFLVMESDLKRVRPHKGSPFARSKYFYKDIWVYATPVGFTWEWRKEDGVKVRNRSFRVR